jgi:hypothetical protein
MSDPKELDIPQEQLLYAAWLDRGMRIGLAVLVASFIVYLLGFVEPHVRHEDLAKLWSMPLADYLKATGGHTGWGWVALVGKGDYLNFVGIVILSGITVLCYLRVLPVFARAKDTVFVVIAVLEILLIVLAASGVLVAGH